MTCYTWFLTESDFVGHGCKLHDSINREECFRLGLFIYHIASSHGNPLKHSANSDYWYNYFSAHPCTFGNRRIVRVKKLRSLESMASFKFHMTLYYLIPLQIFYIVEKLLLGYLGLRPLYTHLLEKYRLAMKLAHIYEPFLFFKGTFNISNTNDLWKEISERER